MIPNDKNELSKYFQAAIDAIGEKEMLNALFATMSADELKDNLEAIFRDYEIDE